MKKLVIMLVVVALLFGAVACTAKTPESTDATDETTEDATDETTEDATDETTEDATDETTEDATDGSKDYNIVVVVKDSTNAWFVRMEKGVADFAAETGINAYQKGPSETDAVQQAQVIEDLLTQDVDAICVVPVDPESLEPVLGRALEKGIVVVTHEASTQENTMYDIEAFKNEDYGAFIMDNLAEAMGYEGKYVTMVGHLTEVSHNEWADGAVAHQLEAYPDMELIEADARSESECNGEIAYQKAKELFKKYPDLKGIMGTSSFDAPGVARAIEELGLQGKAFTCGSGLPNENKELLEKGLVKTLTLWDPAGAGYAMCALATKILDGEEIATGLDLGLEGYDNLILEGKVLIGSGWIVINKDNVDSFGF